MLRPGRHNLFQYLPAKGIAWSSRSNDDPVAVIRGFQVVSRLLPFVHLTMHIARGNAGCLKSTRR